MILFYQTFKTASWCQFSQCLTYVGVYHICVVLNSRTELPPTPNLCLGLCFYVIALIAMAEISDRTCHILYSDSLSFYRSQEHKNTFKFVLELNFSFMTFYGCFNSLPYFLRLGILDFSRFISAVVSLSLWKCSC